MIVERKPCLRLFFPGRQESVTIVTPNPSRLILVNGGRSGSQGEKTSVSSLQEKQPGNLDIEYLINDVLLVPALLQ